MKSFKLTIVVALLTVFGMNVQAQSGGSFAITESVIASGGGQQTTGGAFSLDGTVGQPTAGDVIRRNPFALTSGFWNFTALAPTAASVTVGGRVKTADGRGIPNAEITIMSLDGSTRLARSSSFGYYQFDGIVVGQTYIVSIAAKWLTFAQSTIAVGVVDEISDLDFVAE